MKKLLAIVMGIFTVFVAFSQQMLFSAIKPDLLPENADVFIGEDSVLAPDEEPESPEDGLSSVLSESIDANRASLYLRGGGGDGSMLSADLTLPISSSFEVQVRLFSMEFEVEEEYSYRQRQHYYYWWWYWHRVTYYSYEYRYDTYTVKDTGGEATLIWRPFGKRMFSPYAGIGGRYDDVDGVQDVGASAIAKLGLQMNFGKMAVKVEFVSGRGMSDILGDVSYPLGNSIKLHAFVENIDVDVEPRHRNGTIDNDGYTFFGGGLSFDF